MTTWITVCDICKRDGWLQGDTDGEKLAAEVEAAAAGPRTSKHVVCPALWAVRAPAM